MVSWRGVLDGRTTHQVADYVLTPGSESAAQDPGAAPYAQYCAACHGREGRGNELLEAPDFSNDIWLYGGGIDSVKTSIVQGRKGVMPAFGDWLDATQIRLLVAWLTRDRIEE